MKNAYACAVRACVCVCVCVHDYSDSLHPTATESPGAHEAALLKVHPYDTWLVLLDRK